MAEMVVQALVQDFVRRCVDSIISTLEEMASRADYIKRLESAHLDLGSALEVTKKVPIIDPSLLDRRKKLKRAYEQCGELMDRCKLRVREGESSEQGVTAGSSLARRAIHVVKSFLKNDELNNRNVKKFEVCSEQASNFMRDMESGCSLAHYRFMSPLVSLLFEGKTLFWGARNCTLIIQPTLSEEYGLVAQLAFVRIDPKMPTKGTFGLFLVLRLSASTDMVGIAIERLLSLGPLFKPLAQLAQGELTDLPAQDVRAAVRNLDISHTCVSGCFKANALAAVGPKSIIVSDEMPYKLPDQFTHMCFHGNISEFDKHNLQISSLDGAHSLPLSSDYTFECVVDGAPSPRPRDMEEMVRTRAIDFFNRQPELMEYSMLWFSRQAQASIIVQRRIIERWVRSKTRRVAKRRWQEILVHFYVEHKEGVKKY